MRPWLRLVSPTYRRALRAEARGAYREAASLYAEVGAEERAAEALLHLAERTVDLEARTLAYHDALRWLPRGGSRRREVLGRLGRAVLDEARAWRVVPPSQRERVRDAAARLEEAALFAEAATAYELLERTEDAARCLEQAGEVERLEALLHRVGSAEAAERRVRGLVEAYELAMVVGARREARRSLAQAVAAAPAAADLVELLRELERRRPRADAVSLRVGSEAVLLLGRAHLLLGREGDLRLRGPSLSRRHAEVRLVDGGLEVRDLGSRNGTTIEGVRIGEAARVGGPCVVGLGDDVKVRIEARDGTLEARVEGGVDRGLRARAGVGTVAVEGAPARVCFSEGWPTLIADAGAALVLGEQRCQAPVELLVGDALSVGGVAVEVRG